MRSLRAHFLTVAIAMCCGLWSGAASAGDYTRFGPYVGLNGAYGIDVFGGGSPAAGTLLTSSGSPGLNARLGLRFLTILGVEAQYEWMDGFNIALAGVDVYKLSNHTLTGNLKLFIPIWRIQPYLMGGIGVTWWNGEAVGLAASLLPNQSGTGFAGRLGGGVDVYLTDNILINGEATAVLNTRDTSTIIGNALDNFYFVSVSAGLTYRF